MRVGVLHLIASDSRFYTRVEATQTWYHAMKKTDGMHGAPLALRVSTDMGEGSKICLILPFCSSPSVPCPLAFLGSHVGHRNTSRPGSSEA